MKMAVSIGGFGVLFHRSFSSRIFVELINGVFFLYKTEFLLHKIMLIYFSSFVSNN
jgi:hypothetical protein